MGGQSFKCPLCESHWTLKKQALMDHLRDKHELKDLQIHGSGPTTKIMVNLTAASERIYREALNAARTRT